MPATTPPPWGQSTSSPGPITKAVIAVSSVAAPQPQAPVPPRPGHSDQGTILIRLAKCSDCVESSPVAAPVRARRCAKANGFVSKITAPPESKCPLGKW
jgi:hypothetical protein